MKKFILGLGTAVATVAPIATVIACGGDEKGTSNGTGTGTSGGSGSTGGSGTGTGTGTGTSGTGTGTGTSGTGTGTATKGSGTGTGTSTFGGSSSTGTDSTGGTPIVTPIVTPPVTPPAAPVVVEGFKFTQYVSGTDDEYYNLTQDDSSVTLDLANGSDKDGDDIKDLLNAKVKALSNINDDASATYGLTLTGSLDWDTIDTAIDHTYTATINATSPDGTVKFTKTLNIKTHVIKFGLADITTDACGDPLTGTGTFNTYENWTGITKTVKADGTVVINVPSTWSGNKVGLATDMNSLGFTSNIENPEHGNTLECDNLDFKGFNGQGNAENTFGSLPRYTLTATFGSISYKFEVVFEQPTYSLATPASTSDEVTNLHPTNFNYIPGSAMKFLVHNAETNGADHRIFSNGYMPKLAWDSSAKNVASYGIIVKDLDGGGVMHSILLGLDGTKTTFDNSKDGANDANSATIATNVWTMVKPTQVDLTTFNTHGITSGGVLESHPWVGPFPPHGEKHHYEFTVYAFNAATTAKFAALKTSIASMISGVSTWTAADIATTIQSSLDSLINPILGEAIDHTSLVLTYEMP